LNVSAFHRLRPWFDLLPKDWTAQNGNFLLTSLAGRRGKSHEGAPKFSRQQIALILKQVDDGLDVDDMCRKTGVSQQTYYR
jgi:putative transposase